MENGNENWRIIIGYQKILNFKHRLIMYVIKRLNSAVIWSQKRSFRHNLNQASNQNTSFTKVATLDILIDNMKYKLRLSCAKLRSTCG